MRFRCLNCRKRINVEVLDEKRRVICPRCDSKYWIPGQAEVDAGAVAEPASPIERRATPLVDMLPRPRFFSRRPKPSVALDTQLQVAVLELVESAPVEPQMEPKVKRKPNPRVSAPKWQRPLSPVKDREPAEIQPKSKREKTGILASTSFILTLVALSAVLLTIGFFLSKTALETPEATEAFEIPVNEPDEQFAERQFPKPAPKRAAQREPVEFAELLHRDATTDAESKEDHDDSF